MTLNKEWELLKPKILFYLEEGWSKALAFKKAGFYTSGALYDKKYKNDREFVELIKKYNQKAKGFYGS
jgi:hypothetical protein